MATNILRTKPYSVTSLHLDPKNPRLGRETTARAPREIIQYLFQHDKALEVAQSIVARGYSANEPLLAIKENNQLVVVEGNRRLAALKALREPGLLEGAMQRKLERLSRQIEDKDDIAKVPVIIAPSRKATDRQIAGRHIGTPVLPWQAENRASFILDKLDEGYTNDQLRDQLGFSLSDIQSARQTRAIADMARSLDLPEEIQAKLDAPRTKIFSTIERVMNSSVGRKHLMVEVDSEHGLRGTTTKAEFIKGFTKLVTTIALKKQSSRSLNSNDDIDKYFKEWAPGELPAKKRGSFVPVDIIKGRSVASSTPKAKMKPTAKKATTSNKYVIPRDFKVRYGSERLKDIRKELGKIKREDLPNAGAVLLRVFFELSVSDYLKRTGELPVIIKRIEKKGGKIPFGTPKLSHLIPEIVRIAQEKLPTNEAIKVERALRNDKAAPFSIHELHGFVHGDDYPTSDSIYQFWDRTEPLFRLMLERDYEVIGK